MLFPSLTHLSFFLFSISVVRAIRLGRNTGKTTLSITTKINTAGVGSIVERDRARIQSLKFVSHHNPASTGPQLLNISNGIVYYTAQVGMGTPPTYYTLLVDTGSSNTWVGANQSYVPTNSSTDTGNSVSVVYGSGSFFGEEWLDNVTLTSDLKISQQSVGVASWTVGIYGFDGILGLGPIDLTQYTVNSTFQVPTVMDNLYAQGKISQQVLGVFFVPASESDDSGELTFGGYDDTVTTSTLNYVPLTTTTPAAQYWGIDQSISYGNATVLPSTSGIIDTGTTLILIATDAFQKYQSLTNATLDSTTGLLAITSAQYAALQTLFLNIGSTSYGLTPNAQIWPRSLNSAIGGNASAIYLVVNDIGSNSGSGFDFSNGYAFLQRFYTVFDTTNQRIGIAETIYTASDTN